MPLGLTILANGRLPPQKWKLRSGPTFKSMLSFIPSFILQLKYADRSFLTFEEPEIDKKTLRKRILRYSASKPYNIRYGLSCSVLNKIIKQAKNLRSLTLRGECRVSSFKGIRKIRNLQDLSVQMNTKTILKYPQLFKHFTSLQKVRLYVTWFGKDSKNKILEKFFDSVINLQKLQHLTIWLDESFGYGKWFDGDVFSFKTFLAAIHKAKLPSFEVVLCSISEPQNPSNSQIDWGNFIDTFYVGPIKRSKYQDRGSNGWPLATKPEKRLRLNSPLSNSKIDKLVNESTSIKTLTVKYLFGKDKIYNIKDAKSFLTFVSQVKTLENLTLALDANSENNGVFVSALNKEFAKIESLESLTSFSLDFGNNFFVIIPAISPPYGAKMKNLKTLSLKIWGYDFDLSEFTLTLKELVSLENFDFEYTESRPYSTRESLDCIFPFGELQNLKEISLYCNLPFEKRTREHLMRSLLEVESLKSLNVEGEIFGGFSKKKASEFIEGLCGKKSLKVASFGWKAAQSSRWTEVKIVRNVNGEVDVSSERKR